MSKKTIFPHLRFAELICGPPTVGYRGQIAIGVNATVIKINFRKDVNIGVHDTTSVSPQSFEIFLNGAFEIIGGLEEDDS